MQESDHPKGVVVLEGPNGVGKSFLANAIKARYPVTKIVHCTYRFKNQMFTYHLAAVRRALRFAETGLAILDRNWISEEIYAHVYRGGTKWPHQGRILQKLLLKHGAITVLCLLPEARVLEQVAKHRAQGYHSPQFLPKAEAVAKRYLELYAGWSKKVERNTYVDDLSANGAYWRPDFIRYSMDVDGKNIDLAITNIIKHVQASRELQYKPALQFSQRNITGHLAKARYLIIGDKVNHPDYHKCWPFMAYKNSSLFVAEAMHEINYDEPMFMWTNASCPECHVDAPELKHLKKIALGNKASDTLNRLGIAHVTVPHPSYGRRFMGLSAWTQKLREALA